MKKLNDLQDRRVQAEQLFGNGQALQEIDKLIAEEEKTNSSAKDNEDD